MYKVIIWDVLFFSPSPFVNSSDKVPKVNVEDPQGNAKGVFLMINYKMYGAVTDPFMTGLSQVVEKEGQRQCLPNDPLPPTPHPPPPPPPPHPKKKEKEGNSP